MERESPTRALGRFPGRTLDARRCKRRRRHTALGLESRRIARETREDHHWSPAVFARDGRTLYFLTSRDGFYNLAGIRFDSDRGIAVGQPFDVTHFTSPGLTVVPFMARAEIGIAAHRAVLPMMSSTGSSWMLDNVDK